MTEAQTTILDILSGTERPELQTLLLQGFVPAVLRAAPPYWIVLQPQFWADVISRPSVLLHEPIENMPIIMTHIANTKNKIYKTQLCLLPIWIMSEYSGYYIRAEWVWRDLWKLSDLSSMTQDLERHGVIAPMSSMSSSGVP